MKEEYLFEKIEKIQQEKMQIKNSKEYKFGLFVYTLISLLKSLKFKEIFKMFRDKAHKKKVLKISSIKKEEYFQEKNNVNYKKSKIAIYTCIIGKYDNLQIPLINFENVDYYLFTDNPDNYSDYNKYYKIIKIDEKILKLGKIKANRYIKFHPSEFFDNYDYSMYMDGNIRVISDIRCFINYVKNNTGLAMHLHRERDCIYDEAKVCILSKRGNSKKIIDQIEKYEKENFPHHFGMNEASIIVSDIKNEKSSDLLNKWYEEFVNSESLRDQIAWPYILWKNNLRINDVGTLGTNIYENPKVEMVKHK